MIQGATFEDHSQEKINRVIDLLNSPKNELVVNWVLQKLNVQPNQKILEIGYGPGNIISKIAALLNTGLIAGIDHSDIMFQQAALRNQKYIKTGLCQLKKGNVEDLDFPENYFDNILASNYHFFWNNPVREFKLLNDLLKKEGNLIMVFQPTWSRNNDDVKRIAFNTKNQLERSDFKEVKIEFKEMTPVSCVCITGEK